MSAMTIWPTDLKPASVVISIFSLFDGGLVYTGRIGLRIKDLRDKAFVFFLVRLCNFKVVFCPFAEVGFS